MKKKITALALVICLLAVAVVGGTMAYFTDTDKATNTMTLGNVAIEQYEYQRAKNDDGSYVTSGEYGYKLEEFKDGKPLLPATAIDANGNPYNFGAGDYAATRVKMKQVGSQGSMDVFVNENAQDKFVIVKNTGESDAYVRTIIAYELGSVGKFSDVIMTSFFMVDQGVWNKTDIGPVAIGGNNYYVVEFIYNGAKSLGGVHENGVLPAGETTYPSLAQVYMKATATNEDAKNIDGNNNGEYDILVLSQAVQADGFADAATALKAAFGEVNATNVAEWFTAE